MGSRASASRPVTGTTGVGETPATLWWGAKRSTEIFANPAKVVGIRTTSAEQLSGTHAYGEVLRGTRIPQVNAPCSRRSGVRAPQRPPRETPDQAASGPCGMWTPFRGTQGVHGNGSSSIATRQCNGSLEEWLNDIQTTLTRHGCERTSRTLGPDPCMAERDLLGWAIIVGRKRSTTFWPMGGEPIEQTHLVRAYACCRERSRFHDRGADRGMGWSCRAGHLRHTRT